MSVASLHPHPLGPRLSRLLRAYHLGPDHPMKIRLWGWFRRATSYRRLSVPYAGSGWISDAPIGALLAAHSYELRRIARPGGLLDAKENFLALRPAAEVRR